MIAIGHDILASDFINASNGAAGYGVITDGSGKIDPSFIYPTTPSLPAYANLTAGNPLKIINDGGTIKFSHIFGIGTRQTASSTGGTFTNASSQIFMLSATKFVAIYNVGNSGLTGVVGTISGQTITWGSPVLLIAINAGTLANIVPVSSTAFVIAAWYANGPSHSVECWVATVSGTTITLGSVQNIGYSSGGSQWQVTDVCSPATDVALFTVCNSNNNHTEAVAATVNEGALTLTAGTPFAVATSIYTDSRCHTLSSNRVLVTYNTTEYSVLTLSGTTISSVNASTNASLTQGRFVANGSNVGIYAGTNGCWYASESSGTLSLSNNVGVTPNTGMNSVSVYDSQSWTFLVLTSTTNTIQLVRVSSSVAQSDAGLIISDSVTAVTCFDNQKFITTEAWNNGSGGTWYVTGVVGSLDWNYVIGFAKTSVSAGASVYLNMVGCMETSQSGLLPGLPYYLTPTGSLSYLTTSSVNGVTLNNKKVGQAYASTSLIVNI